MGKKMWKATAMIDIVKETFETFLGVTVTDDIYISILSSGSPDLDEGQK